jgi:hypothetical protein
MKPPIRGFLFSVVAFAAALVSAGVILGTIDAISFRPGGEFNSPWQAAGFDLFIWGVLMLGWSGCGFAVATWPLVALGRTLPAPALVGFIAGEGVVVVAGVGLVNHLQRAVGLSWPLATAVPGVVLGCCAVGVTSIAGLASRPSRAGA